MRSKTTLYTSPSITYYIIHLESMVGVIKCYYFLTVRKIIRFDFADELKIGGLRYICTT